VVGILHKPVVAAEGQQVACKTDETDETRQNKTRQDKTLPEE
jgi:hypothetical protein